MASPTKTTAPDVTTWTKAGRNIKFAAIDGMLFIAVPIDEKTVAASPMSGSGKNKSVGSTLGNIGLDNSPVKFGVNVYAPA